MAEHDLSLDFRIVDEKKAAASPSPPPVKAVAGAAAAALAPVPKATSPADVVVGVPSSQAGTGVPPSHTGKAREHVNPLASLINVRMRARLSLDPWLRSA